MPLPTEPVNLCPILTTVDYSDFKNSLEHGGEPASRKNPEAVIPVTEQAPPGKVL